MRKDAAVIYRKGVDCTLHSLKYTDICAGGTGWWNELKKIRLPVNMTWKLESFSIQLFNREVMPY